MKDKNKRSAKVMTIHFEDNEMGRKLRSLIIDGTIELFVLIKQEFHRKIVLIIYPEQELMIEVCFIKE